MSKQVISLMEKYGVESREVRIFENMERNAKWWQKREVKKMYEKLIRG